MLARHLFGCAEDVTGIGPDQVLALRGDRSVKLSTLFTTQADTRRGPQSVHMIRLGSRLRLTSREVERFTRITGIGSILSDWQNLGRDCTFQEPPHE